MSVNSNAYWGGKTAPTRGKEYIYKSTVRTVYGLTPAMIAELGPPDKLVDNPHYRSGPEASLYLIQRVEAWVAQNRERVETAKANRVQRSATLKKAYAERRAMRFEEEKKQVCEWVIYGPGALPGSLLRDAQVRYKLRGDADYLQEKGLHAYVRHRLTNYDKLLRELYHCEFAQELYPVLRKRFDEVVMKALVEWKGGSTKSPAL
jgi:hypothetical protein